MKILLRIPNWLGDAIMATPAIEMLKQKYPNAKITLLGPEYLQSLFSSYDYVCDNTKKDKFRFKAVLKLAKKIGKFDLAITMQNTFLSAALLYFTNSTKRVGFARGIRSIFLTDAIYYDKDLHQVARFAKLVDSKECTQKLFLACSDIKTSNTIVVAPGAAYGDSKKWPYFDEAIKLICKNSNLDVVIVGAKSDEDTCSVLESRLQKSFIECKNLAGKTSLTELVRLIGGAKLFLTNDSGPMHIASALNVTTIAIFGSTNPNLTGPWMADKTIVLYNKIDCSPCYKRECKFGHYDCLKSITPQAVANLALKATL